MTLIFSCLPQPLTPTQLGINHQRPKLFSTWLPVPGTPSSWKYSFQHRIHISQFIQPIPTHLALRTTNVCPAPVLNGLQDWNSCSIGIFWYILHSRPDSGDDWRLKSIRKFLRSCHCCRRNERKLPFFFGMPKSSYFRWSPSHSATFFIAYS